MLAHVNKWRLEMIFSPQRKQTASAISRRAGPAAMLLAGLLLLAGCAGKPPAALPPCPDTGLMLGAAQLYDFKAGAEQTEPNRIIAASIENYRGACRYENGQMDFELELDFSAWRGAQGTTLERGQFPYFIAVLDAEESVLQRQGFSTTVPFDKTGAGLKTEKHRLRLPLAEPKDAAGYKVVIGFQLTPEQLAYNRGGEKPAPAPEKAAKPQKKKKK